MMRNAESVRYEEIDVKVRRALDDLRQKDHQLLKTKAHEIAITHQMACYLKKYFPSWHVDCEYNRREGLSKINSHGEDIRPDIIIHERYDPDKPNKKNNLLVIEVKKNESGAQNDRDKLIELTRIDGNYCYKFGISLCISVDLPYSAKWDLYYHGRYDRTIMG